MADMERLRYAQVDDFSPTYDQDAIKAGIKGGIGGAAMGVFYGMMVLLVVGAVTKSILGKGITAQFPSGSYGPSVLIWGIVMGVTVLLAVGAFLTEARKKGRENARRRELVAATGRIEERRKESEERAAQLEKRIADLRGQMVRLVLTEGVRKLIWERDNKTCYLCGRGIESWSGEYMHVDHFLPWSRGGSNDPENLRATHVRCNLRKGNRIVAGD
jgi:5-methylcytosine-specific restriction endonuclease McrA